MFFKTEPIGDSFCLYYILVESKTHYMHVDLTRLVQNSYCMQNIFIKKLQFSSLTNFFRRSEPLELKHANFFDFAKLRCASLYAYILHAKILSNKIAGFLSANIKNKTAGF